MDDGTSNNYIAIIGSNSGSEGPYGEVRCGGVPQSALVDGNETPNTDHTLAFAYKKDDVASCKDAGVVKTDTTALIPAVNQLLLGYSGAYSTNGHIRRLAYYRKRIPDNQLQALTS
jgi:hypothetical protein